MTKRHEKGEKVMPKIRIIGTALALLAGVLIVGTGIRADQVALEEEAMRVIYGASTSSSSSSSSSSSAGTCWQVRRLPTPDCPHVDCLPGPGYKIRNYGTESCVRASSGWETCTVEDNTRKECEVWVYTDVSCTSLVHHAKTFGPKLVTSGYCP